MARTYRYRWEGNRMLVAEYYNGRLQHEYHGYMTDNGYSVDIYPIKGQRSYGDIPYVGKRIPRASDGADGDTLYPDPALPRRRRVRPYCLAFAGRGAGDRRADRAAERSILK